AVTRSRLKIPLLLGLDVIHGYRTIFPIPLAEASSWDPELVEAAARMAGREARANGINWTFAPMVDIARDPRWGRIVEGAGEDPYLGSVLAAAQVRGFQGEDLGAPNTLLATAKHFAAYGAAEGGRDYATVDLSERTLREVYLPPFHAAVRAGAGSVMAAFNEISGIPAHASTRLLTGILRDEWGFDGVLVSDYTGIAELRAHGIADSRAEAGTIALRAGVDVDMVSGIYLGDLPLLVNERRIPLRLVDAAVRRVLEAKAALGLFEAPYRYGDPAREVRDSLPAAHREFARALARASIVLLKNDPPGPGEQAQGRDPFAPDESGATGVLPLSRDQTIAVIGPLAVDRSSPLGPWAAAGRPADVVTVLEGIRRAVSPGTRVSHVPGAYVSGADTTGFRAARRAARDADAVVLVLGETREMSGEAASRASIELPGVQSALARAVLETGTPTAVVLLNGRPLAIPELAERAPAILEAWFPGVEAGSAIADVLFGDYNPGGKLPVTFPRATGQVPIYYAHKRTGRPPDPEQKYTSKYLDVHWTPLYPFGHGLSYTEFAYSDLRLDAAELVASDSLWVRVDVENVGARAGEEVVQLYLRDDVASVTRPVRELRRFRKIRLEPGESRTVSFQLMADDFAFLGPEMERIVEPGRFTVFVGGSSVGGLETSFRVVGRSGGGGP
ncbi:MAG: glycoside hydrolase family 3 N-terminal domain-containing protein, partial [Gemmatimonadota bacterium]